MDSGPPRRRRAVHRRIAAGARAGGSRPLPSWCVCPGRSRRWRVCCHGLSLGGPAAECIPAAEEETRPMTQQRFPAGWDEQRVQQLLAELDARTEAEWVAADEAA